MKFSLLTRSHYRERIAPSELKFRRVLQSYAHNAKHAHDAVEILVVCGFVLSMDPSQPNLPWTKPVQGGAAAVCAVYGVLAIVNALHVRNTGYQLYAPVLIGCIANAVAYGAYAAYWTIFRTGMLSLWMGLGTAGFGIQIFNTSLVLNGWCRNVHPAYALSFTRKLVPLGKVIAVLALLAGPLCGIASTGLLFAGWTVRMRNIATSIRTAAMWGMWCALLLQTGLLLFLSAPVSWPYHPSPKHSLWTWKRGAVLWMWPIIWLLFVSAAFRVVTTFISSFYMDPELYFPFIAAPELLGTILLSWPFLAAQAGLGGQLDTFKTVHAAGRSWKAFTAVRRAHAKHALAEDLIDDERP